jgi:hypothetical protein
VVVAGAVVVDEDEDGTTVVSTGAVDEVGAARSGESSEQAVSAAARTRRPAPARRESSRGMAGA